MPGPVRSVHGGGTPTEAIVLTPRPLAAQGELTAIGPARRPYSDFLKALGRSHTGNPAGIVVTGAIDRNGGGAFEQRLTQSGQCADSRTLGQGGIELQIAGKRLVAHYVPLAALRVRCPGPELAADGSPRASTNVPRSVLTRREFSISIPSVPAFTDHGYTGTLAGRLSLTVKRGQVTESFGPG